MNPRETMARLHRWLVPPESGQGWTAYLWLIYLGFFTIEWWFRPVPTAEWVAAAATLPVFLALYFSGYRRRGPAALAHIAGICALGIAWSPFHSGAAVLFIYAAAFAFNVGPPRRSAWVVGLIAVVAAACGAAFQPEPYYYLPAVFISVIIGAANIFFGEQHRRNAELRLTQAEVRRLARVAERERIARDLHDVLGHTLSLIAVKSELAGRLVDTDPARTGAELRSIHESARSALAEVREAIGGFREQTLEQAFEHVDASLRAADIELRIERDPDLALAPNAEAMLALVIREAATNVIRHSDARTCRIRLTASGGSTRLEVEDDGSGGIRADGGGVQGMRARVESLGGELTIDDNGKRLVATIPESTG